MPFYVVAGSYIAAGKREYFYLQDNKNICIVFTYISWSDTCFLVFIFLFVKHLSVQQP